jgi:anti-sigma-K factor RskA
MAQPDKSAAAACAQWEEDLVLHYYGELRGSERTAIEDHMRDCEPCRFYVKELAAVLPLAAKPDEPPQDFWDNYSREMRRKLTEVKGRRPWWQNLISYAQPWLIPISATAVVAILALALTFGKGFWSGKESPQDDEAFMEILPAAENLEFFKTMEILDAMDFLENVGNVSNRSA